MKTKSISPTHLLFLLIFTTLSSPLGLAEKLKTTPLLQAESLTLTGALTVTDETCGLCNGAIDLVLSGGAAPFEFIWSNGESTEDITNLCAGIYMVTVTDATGCTFTDGIMVTDLSISDVTLGSQAEVDAFVSTYGDCTEINGNLFIGTTINGPLSDITDLSGFSSFTIITGNLSVIQNSDLNNLFGLGSLTSIGDSLHIGNNNSISSLIGLGSITNLNGDLIIEDNDDLLILDGLDQLITVGGNVIIDNNTSLLDISGLNQLENIGGHFDLQFCPELYSLSGLELLTAIGGDLILKDDINLADLSSLDHPISIGGNLTIKNTNLSNCNIEPVCTLLQTSASADIQNNNGGCNSASEIISLCADVPIDIQIEPTHITCSGACNGALTVTVIGGNPPFLFNWSTGDTTPDIDSLCSGSYELTVTDNFGISHISAFDLLEPFPMAISLNFTSIACFGSCDGSVSINIMGGTPPYSYNIPGKLCPGNYSAIVTDNKGCTGTIEFDIPGTDAIDFTLDEIGDVSAGQADGYIDVSIAGGTAPLSYEWMSNGAFISAEEDLDGLGAGIYILIITDGLGCSTIEGPFTVETQTGLSHVEKEAAVQLYPNPAKEGVYVSFVEPLLNPAKYSLWDTRGTLMTSDLLLPNEIETPYISLDGLASGIYFLKIEVGVEILVKKIILL